MTALRPIAAGEISIARMQAQIDGALRMLAASTNPAEIVTIHSMAEAIRYAAKRAKLGLGGSELCCGTATAGRTSPPRPAERSAHARSSAIGRKCRAGIPLWFCRSRKPVGTLFDIIRLDDLGISRDLSARSQRIAAIPATKFESYFLSAREAGWEITWGGTNGLIYRAETDMFDLTRQRRRNGAEYNPFNRRPQSEFAPSTPPVVTI